MDQIYMLFRVALAIAAGTAIGMERAIRYKEAGIRTHALICGGAALFVVVSQYGFFGDYDASRVASTIVSGIGFLGAGMILHKRVHIHGLTTAAGMWATSAIGMAMGAGMYILAAGSTLLVIFVQLIMIIEGKLFRSRNWRAYKVVYELTPDNHETLCHALAVRKTIRSISTRNDNSQIMCHALVRADRLLNSLSISDIMQEHPFIYSIEQAEDNDLG